MKVVVACAQDIIVNLLEAAAANDNGRKLMVMMMMIITINANEDIKVDCIAVVGRSPIEHGRRICQEIGNGNRVQGEIKLKPASILFPFSPNNKGER